MYFFVLFLVSSWLVGQVTVLYLWIMIFKFQFDSIYLIYSKFTVMFFNSIFISTWDLFKFSLFSVNSVLKSYFENIAISLNVLFMFSGKSPGHLFSLSSLNDSLSFLSPLIFLMFCTDCIHLKRSGHSDYFVSFVYVRGTGGINGAEDT